MMTSRMMKEILFCMQRNHAYIIIENTGARKRHKSQDITREPPHLGV
jgi:hypothetical protein